MLQKLDMKIPVEILGLDDVNITEVHLRNHRELIIKVESTKKETPCRKCGKLCKAHGYDRAMEMRHLPTLGYKTFIQLTPKRGICTECDEKPVTTTQTLSWYDRHARQTKPYEQHLLFELINSTVADISRKEEVDQHMIEKLIDKHVNADVDFSKIEVLDILGIDEISLRKGRQKYITVITYRHEDEVRLLKIINGRYKKDIQAFLKSIPKRLKRTVTAVCTDLYEGYINAAKAVFGDRVITADRFHVAKLYRKQLIAIRKSELKKLRKKLSAEEYKKLKPAIAILTKGKDYFTDTESKVLESLFSLSPSLKQAYEYSHRLTTIFNTKYTKEEAIIQLKQWITDVSTSSLTCFNKFIGTLTKYMNEISNYFLERNSSGFVEGFNNRLKVLTRRCYGLKSIQRFFQRVMIDTQGLEMFHFSGDQIAV